MSYRRRALMNFIINATDELATRPDYIVSNESRQMKRLPAGCPIVKFNDRERMRGIDYEINRSIAFSSPLLFASIPIIPISIFFYTMRRETEMFQRKVEILRTRTYLKSSLGTNEIPKSLRIFCNLLWEWKRKKRKEFLLRKEILYFSFFRDVWQMVNTRIKLASYGGNMP